MRQFKRGTLLLGLISICGAGLAAEAATTFKLNIPAQPIGRALNELARQSGLQVVIDPDEAGRITAPRLAGTYTVEAALGALLANSGLRYEYLNDRTIAVRARSADSAEKPAHTNEPAATPLSESRVLVEEVIVSAQKRGDELLRDVPIPVTAVDAQKLVSNNQLRLRDYYTTVPGLTLSPEFAGNQFVAIRGITTGRASVPTVGMVIDDVPYGYTMGGTGIMPDVDPGDLARVEVLRGPQGALYGASSMGGLIKYVTRDPSLSEYGGRVEAGTQSVRNGDGLGYNLRASANLPLGDTFAVRASGFARREPGYIDNPVRGLEGVNQIDAGGGLLAGLWQPSDSLSLKLSTLYQHTDGDGQPEVEVRPGLGDLQQNFVPNAAPYERTIQAHSAILKAKLGQAELTSLTGYNVNRYNDVWDATPLYLTAAQRVLGPSVAGAPSWDDVEVKKVSQELRLSAPLGPKIDGFLGAFYTYERFAIRALTVAQDAAAVPLGTLVDSNGQVSTYKEYAVFGDLTFHLTERFDLQVGGRQSRIKVADLRGTLTGAIVAPSSVVPANSTADVFTYLVTPRFKLSPNVMLYGRFASGYRPGGPNKPQILSSFYPPPYENDSIGNYEIGIKGDLFDGLLSVDTSLYYIDWKDIQLNVTDPRGSYRTNGSGARSEGVELSVTVRPAQGFSVDAWVDYDNAVLTRNFPTGSPVAGAPGDRLPYSSKWSGHVSLQKDFPITNGMDMFVGAAWSYVGERTSEFRAANVARAIFPQYTMIDLRTGIAFDAWTANLFINNVDDERGVLNQGFYVPYRYTYVQPRTFGFSIARTF